MRRRTVSIVVASVVAALALLIIGTVLVLTQTEWGHERVRRLAVAQLQKAAHGLVHVGHVSGNLLDGMTLDDVAITDSSGAPFVRADTVVATYGLGSLFRKHITLNDVRLVHPVVVLDRKTGGKWNWDRIFPRDTVKHPSTGAGFGSWITLTNVRVVDGRVTIRAPWKPSDTLSARLRDSVVTAALSPLGRQRIERVGTGFQRVSDFRDIYGTLPLLRLADPNDPKQLIQIATVRMTAEPMKPPSVRVTDARGLLTVLNDSLYFQNVYLALAGSRATGSGRYNFDNDDLRLRLHADTVATNDLLWIDPSIPQDGHGKMDFALDWVGPVSDYLASNASLAVAGATLSGSLGVQVTDTFAFHDTNMRFAHLDTRTIQQLFPTIKSPRQGWLTGQLAAAGGFRAMHVDGDVAFDDPRTGRSHILARGMVGGGPGEFRAGELHLTLSPFRVALARAVAPSMPAKLGGTVTGTAVLDGSTKSRMTASGDLTHHDVTGASRVVGTAAFAFGDTPLINANLRLLPLSLATVGQFAPAAGLHGSVRGPVKLTGPMRDLALDATLTTPDGGSIAARGTLDLVSRMKGYDLATTMHLFDASQVSTKAPRTSLSADATVRGAGFDLATLHAVATAKVRTSTYDSIAVDSATLRATAAGGMLTLDTLMLRVPAGRADLAGTFGLTRAHAGTLRYALAIDSLGALQRLVPPADTAGAIPPRPAILASRVARASSDSSRVATKTEVERAVTGKRPPRIVVDTPRAIPRSTLAGSIQAQGVATGNIHTFDLNGTASGKNIVALGNAAQSFTAKYAWNTAFTPQSRVSADVTAVKVLAAGFALDTVSLNTAYRKPNGTVSLAIRQDTGKVYTVNAAYELEKQQNLLRLDQVKLRFDTVTYASTRPSLLHWGPNGVDVNQFELRSAQGSRVYVDGRIPTKGSADVQLDVTQFDIGNLLALLQSDIPARGLVSVDMRAQGTRAAPVLKGAFGLQNFTYGTRPTPELHGRFDYANQTLTTDLTAMREGGPVIATARGTVPINLALTGVTGSRIPRDRTIAATVRADSLPLDLVPQFTDMVANLNGRAFADFTIGGTVNQPNVNGRLALWNGSVKVVPLGITLHDVATNIRMTRDTVIIDSLVARSGGQIRVTGGVGIKSLAAPSFALVLDARNARLLDNDKGTINANAHLAMRGPFNDVLVTGDTRVLRGVVYIPESSNKTLVGAGDPALFSVLDTAIASQRALFPAQSPFLANLRMAVGLMVDRDVFVRSGDANVELFTENPLEISVDRGKQTVVLDGVLLSDRGEYRFQSRRFQIKQGSATFVNTPGLNPTLQVTGEYDVQIPSREAIAIRIIISGTLDQPKIALESDAQPPISQTDLLSYLAFGQSSSSLLQLEGSGLTSGGTGNGNIVGKGAAFAAKQVSAAALGALTDQISGEAIRSLGADFFNIAPADVQLDAASFLRGTQIEFGKYLQTRTFLQLQVRPDPASLQRPGFQLVHRFSDKGGYRVEASFEPRYLLRQPSLSPDQNPTTTSAFGLFLVREWRY